MGQREGKKVDWQRLMPSRGFSGVAEEMGGGANLLLLVGAEQADELMDYERLCDSAEAFIYLAMIRLMVRRLAHA